MVKSNAIPVKLANGSTLNIEVGDADLVLESSDGERAVAGFQAKSLRDALAPIEGLSDEVLQIIKHSGPSKAAVEFGIEVGIEFGQLTALLVKGTAKANLKITLHWENLGVPPKAGPTGT